MNSHFSREHEPNTTMKEYIAQREKLVARSYGEDPETVVSSSYKYEYAPGEKYELIIMRESRNDLSKLKQRIFEVIPKPEGISFPSVRMMILHRLNDVLRKIPVLEPNSYAFFREVESGQILFIGDIPQSGNLDGLTGYYLSEGRQDIDTIKNIPVWKPTRIVGMKKASNE